MSEPERGLSHGDRRQRAAQVFGDPVPCSHPPAEPVPVVEDPDRPNIWDRSLVGWSEFRSLAVGLRTFGFWYGGQVPKRGDVVVYVEHRSGRDAVERPYGASVAFALGEVAALGWAHGRPNKHVASLLALPGITRVPTYGPGPWGFCCDVCGAFPPPACWRFRDQSEALMAAVGAGLSVALAGLVCAGCLEGAGDVRRAQIGYEV